MRQVSACAQGGKGADRFHIRGLFRSNFDNKITLRNFVNRIIKKLSLYDNNFRTPRVWGRVVALNLVFERLAAGLAALRRPANRRPKPRRAFSGLQSGGRVKKPRGGQARVASRPHRHLEPRGYRRFRRRPASRLPAPPTGTWSEPVGAAWTSFASATPTRVKIEPVAGSRSPA